MSEFEFIEAFHLAQTWLIEAVMSGVAIISAYIVATYIVGEHLTKKVATGMTTIYSLFLVGPLGGMAAACTMMINTIEQYLSAYPEGWAFDEAPGVGLYLTTLFPLVLTWIASLFYLHLYARRDPSR